MNPSISVAISPKTREELRKLSRDTAMPVAGIIRAAIHEYLTARGIKIHDCVERQARKGYHTR